MEKEIIEKLAIIMDRLERIERKLDEQAKVVPYPVYPSNPIPPMQPLEITCNNKIPNMFDGDWDDYNIYLNG